MTRRYVLAFGKDFLDPKTVRKEATADKIVAAFRKFHVIPVTQAEYAALDARSKAVHKKASGFVLGGEYGGAKTKADCQFKSIVTLDLDALTPEIAQQCIETLRGAGASGFIYSTASHRPDSPRLRAVLFLARDVTPDEYVRLIDVYAQTLPQGAVSNESRKVGQLMYLPQRCSDGEELFIELTGNPVDPDPMLASAPPLPERDPKVQPARDKPGIVGAVARLFEDDFDRAIEELKLPYTRSTVGPTCAAGEDRYTYAHGTTADGAIYYPKDGHLFSYHGSDPCFGQNATIFDVWRLHNADPAKDDPNAPIHERASHKAAQEWFVRRFPQLQGEVRVEPDVSELEDLGPPERPLEAVERAVQEAIEPDKEPATSRFPPIPAELFSAGKPQDWLVKGIVSRGAFGVVYGASGSGKSFIVWELAACVALGIPFRGHKVKQGRVLWLAAEGAGGLSARILAYSRERGVELTALPAIMPYAPNLLEAQDTVDLVKSIQAWGHVDLIVVDTLSATTPGSDENAGKDMGKVVAHVNAIIRITKAAVLLIHHSGKDATRGARGWSGLRAACDVELEVTRNGDIRMLTHTKAKDGMDGKQYAFRLKIVKLGLDEDGDEITSCVTEEITIEPAGPGIQLTGLQRETLSILQQHWSDGHYDRELLIEAVAETDDAEPPDTSNKTLMKNRKSKAFRRIKPLIGKCAFWHLDKTQIKPTPALDATKEFDDE